MSIRYTSHLLPTDDDKLIPILAKAYTALRIKGLQQSPESFSANIQDEEGLTEQEQIARIKVKNKWIVVIVASEDKDDSPWYEKEWVAQATLFGPNQWKDHIAPFKTAHKPEDHLTDEQLQQMTQVSYKEWNDYLFWHMTALYVDINHRKKGLANQVCLFAFDVLQQNSFPKNSEIRIFVHPNNTVVMKMYEKMNFQKQNQTISLAEAYFAAGDQSILPKDYQDRKRHTDRLGLVMTKLISTQDGL